MPSGNASPVGPMPISRSPASISARRMAAARSCRRGPGRCAHASALARGRAAASARHLKTGLAGPSRAIAAQIAASAPERVLVLVDACQLRCPAGRLQADLDGGFMVLITGSKFAGGPPLSGALMLPEAITTQLRRAPLPPEGLADYSARLDWPEPLQATFARDMTTTANLGLGLRWRAALAELKCFAAVDPRLQQRFLTEFERRCACSPAGRPRRRAGRQRPWLRCRPISSARADARGRPVHVRRRGSQGQARLRTRSPPRPSRAARAPTSRRIFQSASRCSLVRARCCACAPAPRVNAVAEQGGTGGRVRGAFAPSAATSTPCSRVGHVLSGECA